MGYSGAGGKLTHAKNQKEKISWHCPFKGEVQIGLNPYFSLVLSGAILVYFDSTNWNLRGGSADQLNKTRPIAVR